MHGKSTTSNLKKKKKDSLQLISACKLNRIASGKFVNMHIKMFFKQPCKINSLPVPCSLCNALFGFKMLKKKHITFVFTERLRKTNSIHSTVNTYTCTQCFKIQRLHMFLCTRPTFQNKINETFYSVGKRR